MTVAYLIAAHADPASLQRLVTSLDSSSIYVHIDGRVEEAPFRAVAPTARFVVDRENVTWGGWSQVLASLSLLRTSLEDVRHDRFVLLSGDSFPTQPQQGINTFFASTPQLEFINAVRMPSESRDKPLSRLSQYHIAHNREYTPTSVLARAFNRLGLPVCYRRLLEGWVPYGGSTWWAISRRAAEAALAVTRDRPRLIKLARHAKMPDEFFFQTVLLNSVSLTSIRPSVMYADWTHPTDRPAVIGKHHVAQLASAQLRVAESGDEPHPILFARKVRSEEVARSIQDTLWPISLN